MFAKPIDWIDEVERNAKEMYELDIKDFDYVVDEKVTFEELSELPLMKWED